RAVGFVTAEANARKEVANESDPDTIRIAAAAIKHQAPPVIGGGFAGKMNKALESEIIKQGGDYPRLVNEWNSAQNYVKTMGGERQLVTRQAIDTTSRQLDTLEKVYGEWQKAGAASGFQDWNKLSLAALAKVPGEGGVAATRLLQQLGDTKIGTN